MRQFRRLDECGVGFRAIPHTLIIRLYGIRRAPPLQVLFVVSHLESVDAQLLASSGLSGDVSGVGEAPLFSIIVIQLFDWRHEAIPSLSPTVADGLE